MTVVAKNVKVSLKGPNDGCITHIEVQNGSIHTLPFPEKWIGEAYAGLNREGRNLIYVNPHHLRTNLDYMERVGEVEGDLVMKVINLSSEVKDALEFIGIYKTNKPIDHLVSYEELGKASRMTYRN